MSGKIQEISEETSKKVNLSQIRESINFIKIFFSVFSQKRYHKN